MHERNRASRHEVTELWSLADLERANLALAVQDEAEHQARVEQDRQAMIQRELSKHRR